MPDSEALINRILTPEDKEKLRLNDIRILSKDFEPEPALHVEYGEADAYTGIYGLSAYNLVKEVYSRARYETGVEQEDFLDSFAADFGGEYTHRVYLGKDLMRSLDENSPIPALMSLEGSENLYPITIESKDQLREDLRETEVSKEIPENIQVTLRHNSVVVPAFDIGRNGNLVVEAPAVIVRREGEQIVASPDDGALDEYRSLST